MNNETTTIESIKNILNIDAAHLDSILDVEVFPGGNIDEINAGRGGSAIGCVIALDSGKYASVDYGWLFRDEDGNFAGYNVREHDDRDDAINALSDIFVDAVANAKSLTDLCDLLNDAEETLEERETLEDVIDFTSLKTFGNNELDDTLEIYSYDDTHVMTQATDGRAFELSAR